MQTLLTYLILALAVAYALWRAYVAIRQSSDPCYGCSGCALKEAQKAARKKKADCPQKK
ncbi:MAG: FeoB-associated Cys-rich membrane protein [Prevotella sp.]|nr:FeoB-associated Cys-rich membrane protein [Prevotella sp.]